MLHCCMWKQQCQVEGRCIMDKYVCVCARALSHVQLFATLWTVALQAPLPMGFSRQEDWNGLPFPPPGESS